MTPHRQAPSWAETSWMASKELGVAASWASTEGCPRETHPAPGEGFPKNGVSLSIYHRNGPVGWQEGLSLPQTGRGHLSIILSLMPPGYGAGMTDWPPTSCSLSKPEAC